MSINVKNREAEALLEELKRRSGKGTTDLLLDLLRREKARVDASVAAELREAMESARRLQATWNALPIIDPRPIDEILDYGDDGLPR